VDVTKEEGVVESSQPVPDSHNVPPDMEEMILAEQALLSHPEFKAAVAKLDLPSNATVVADGWIYGGSTVLLRVVLTSLGADKFEKSQRYISFMVYLSFSDDPDTCHYAAPLPLVPVIDAEDFTLVEIEYTPILGTGDKTLLDLGEVHPERVRRGDPPGGRSLHKRRSQTVPGRSARGRECEYAVTPCPSLMTRSSNWKVG
jgi:Cu2+-containing amine oxidase